MSILANIEPRDVFRYFEEICKIPHGSGNVDKISDYLVDFAKAHELEFYQDKLKNVIIIKNATAGYENEPAVIIQGHMDMVCVKTKDCGKDMKKEGLDLGLDGDYIYAKGTSLGGDDGIAVAYGLALLSSKTLQHPRLEVVVTVDEEVGMEGATGIDLSMLKGKLLLNMDSEEEGILTTSCAGGARVKCELPIEYENLKLNEMNSKIQAEIQVFGLIGGHSGVEIDKNRGNANFILGEALLLLRENKVDFSIFEIGGGVADNAIPSSAKAQILIQEGMLKEIKNLIQEQEKILKNQFQKSDPGLMITCEKISCDEAGENEEILCMDKKSADSILNLFQNLPNGIQAMSQDIKGLVETSLNLGILIQKHKKISFDFSVRSSVEESKVSLIKRLSAVTRQSGGDVNVTGDYPSWEYRKDSLLRKKMMDIYREMFGQEPEVQAIHAGLECGILASKIKGLDAVSFGPDMKDIHTPKERLSMSSTKRMWDYTVKILETKQTN